VLFPEPATPNNALVSPREREKELHRGQVCSQIFEQDIFKDKTGPEDSVLSLADVSMGRVGTISDRPALAQNPGQEKSMTTMSTDDTTTAWVVPRPTPWVPPLRGPFRNNSR